MACYSRKFKWMALFIAALSLVTVFGTACASASPAVPAATVAPPTAVAAKSEHVLFVLDWVIFGRHTPYFVALDKGYWTDNGLDVTILKGNGSADSIKRLAAGQADFVFADLGGLVLARANEGVKAKMVAITYGLNGHAVFFLDDSIKTPKDLVGKTIAGAPGATVTALFPGFLQANGINPSDVKLINADANSLNTLLLSKKVDGMLDFNFNQVALEKAGKPQGLNPKNFMYAKYNFAFYANGIMTKDETMSQKPELVRKFVDGIVKGLDYTFANPVDACKIMRKYNPDIDQDVCEGEVALVKDSAVTPETQANGWGYMTTEKVQATIDVLRKYMGFTGAVTPADLFTNDFLPKKK